ncbi:uncharacterized protein LOC117293562 [Asterias rubens]|uniref:uncharacterized protein LOC117293562 n=1 Tax=Asterias rubens TaxID=7604 RepID=UPI00145594AE|nr:uncharacterized protein LOC117293562 [Asterias rubens]
MAFSSGFLTVVICVVQSVVVGAQSCTKVDDCSCQNTDGKQVNLQSLGYKDSNTPRFFLQCRFPYKLGPASAGWEYAYNPCYPFSDGSAACKNAVVSTIVSSPRLPNLDTQILSAADFKNVWFFQVCQRKQNTPSEIYNIGDATATWNNGGVSLYIEYSHTDDATPPVTRTSRVSLVCDPGADVPKLDRMGQDEGDTLYQFTLTTKCACPGTCGTSPSPSPSSGISPGTILCILFSVLVVAYFVGGALFLRFGRHAQGKEIIPNYEMWVGVPENIKVC